MRKSEQDEILRSASLPAWDAAIDALRGAATLLRAGWCQNRMKESPAMLGDAPCFCLWGAVDYRLWGGAHGKKRAIEAKLLVAALLTSAIPAKYWSREPDAVMAAVFDFNDDPLTSQADVVRTAELALERAVAAREACAERAKASRPLKGRRRRRKKR